MTPTHVLIGVGLLIVLLSMRRSGARRAREVVSLAGRVLVTAGFIVGAQWVVVLRVGPGWLLLAVLAVPALFAAYTLTRALTVTTYEMPTRRRGGRR
ncbi:hypothetical protein GCM10017788_28620 [Amycolatopsis acidiphila]|uniref:Uncharacterized protein n=2 Tax=Amycolatopsis acidiphila TaxID=715473 RepID=A0A558A717_9PSEU|nr:hypothetical protein FNH06_22120 [Amycolatopsis acidiphila]GHG68678.1 hypothetical protein GCM10017788_28620 [Amycolatopsis acidiphila]